MSGNYLVKKVNFPYYVLFALFFAGGVYVHVVKCLSCRK